MALAPVAAVCADDETQADVAYLWPCNVKTWAYWQAVQTQWRVGGMGGATGLDYAGVRAYLDETGVKSKQRKQIFEGIRAAETATLRAWGEKAEKAAQDKKG
jgi:hypothetical protein